MRMRELEKVRKKSPNGKQALGGALSVDVGVSLQVSAES